MSPTPAGPSSPSRRAAWIAVAVLWPMAFLYYFDRLLITSMRPAIRLDIPMTDAQFGLLTSGFLWVYGCLSPIGGFIADRWGRRPIIVASLLIWSVGVWFTGHAHTYSQLLSVRMLLGAGEACFLPAAFALISNHHPGPTRSRAIGLLNTGLYVGSALGGAGGWLAEHFGWRSGYSLLGVVGLAYCALVAVLLQDTPPPVEIFDGSGPRLAARGAGRALLANGAFWILVGVYCFGTASNWLCYAWLPTYLRDRFHLSAGAAGLSATSYLQAGTFLGVIVGSFWADWWSLRQNRARAWVAAVGFTVAVPGLFLVGSSPVFLATVIGLMLFGVGRGFFDTNCMPILRQISAQRYSATGYGFLTFAGCIAGGLITYGSGALLDAKVSLAIVFRCAAFGMGIAAVGLALLKSRSRRAT